MRLRLPVRLHGENGMALVMAVGITTVLLIVATTALAVGGLSLVKRGVPPIPERAVTEAKLTVEALKGNGRA